MALVTFSNPDYKDKTVYAVAGSHTQTILKLALENKIPIHFNCQDGACGACMVKVTSLDKKAAAKQENQGFWKTRMGGPLTDKEKNVLVQLGQLTKQAVEQMAVDDLPCDWRLACQVIVRDEDILVEY